MNLLMADESIIRISIFIGVLLIMILVETLLPRRERVQKRSVRWLTNISLVIIDSIVLKIALPFFAVTLALICEKQGWGLFNLVDLPLWLQIPLAIMLLDMAIYWQHVATHHIPILWRLHKVHHSDRDIDVTTGIRFHPIEIILSMLYKMVCVLLIGPAIVAVVIFEILLNACAMFNHANVRINNKVDHYLRFFLVTPDMHRVHHSVINDETNSNYGFFLSIWDRFFSSYIPQPSQGHDAMDIGLTEYQDNKPSNIFWALVIPFKKSN